MYRDKNSMTITSAGIAWAVPVRPDALGAHLEAYDQALPTLYALRLCHRFGKGPDVYITRLPFELVLSIEDITIDHMQNKGQNSEWEETFRHFESRCEPLDHDEREILSEFSGFDELCDSCKTEWCVSCKECEMLTRDKENLFLNENYNEWHLGGCIRRRKEWETLINQMPKGNFEKYDKLLRKHFGLEAFFANTRMAQAPASACMWLKDPNHEWHNDDQLQTTICYLTLPKTMAGGRRFVMSELESELMSCNEVSVNIGGAISSFVTLPKMIDKGSIEKRFHSALGKLKLQPHIHPSQLSDTVTAEAIADKSQSDRADGDEIPDHQRRGSPEIEWPRLVMLVKASSHK